jgi:hypothetical protein
MKPIFIFLFSLAFIGIGSESFAQDTVKVKAVDSTKVVMNTDAVYNRPFLVASKFPVALGGYLEANTQYVSADGVAEGFSFQFRRMTIFLSSTISERIRFLAELELEDGTKEINLEFAAIDVEFHPLVNLRSGIILNPIGAFNQNHDGPRWNFVDRPLSATTIIPSTLSNVGFGIYGKAYLRQFTLAYETYLTNGFDNAIIDNEENRTSLASGKLNPFKFEESNSGSPMLTAKVAIKKRSIGELGVSYMGGVYNKWKEDGLVVDKKRKMHVLAVDFTTSLFKKVDIVGEVSRVFVDVPSTYSQQYGTGQWGGYTDVIYTLLHKEILNWKNAKLQVAARVEYVDYNRDTFAETGGKIGDSIFALVPGVAFRPSGQTVFRVNYRHQRQYDLFNNPASASGSFQVGISTYF